MNVFHYIPISIYIKVLLDVFLKNWSFPEKHCFPSNRGNYVLFCDIIFSGAPF